MYRDITLDIFSHLLQWILKSDCGFGNFQQLINSEDTVETKALGYPQSTLWCDLRFAFIRAGILDVRARCFLISLCNEFQKNIKSEYLMMQSKPLFLSFCNS